ncbi:M15 family metallopeptidase [Aquimarina sp. 2304DJ70-9]|uniref:M15 family metallopeptidase n=1 Tax=Aquimarina penaris TaxID=3231044 RepID=UPI003462AB08
MIEKKLAVLVFSMLFFSCSDAKLISSPGSTTIMLIEKSKALRLKGDKVEQRLYRKKDSIEMSSGNKITQSVIKGDDFVNIETVSNDFVLDMKYATSDNFLKEKVYSCARCYVRKNVAEAIIKANKDFMAKGYRIKFFDCYRPHSVQKKMWKIFPNPGYVADPKGGSIHNKGAALDLTLVKLDGSAVDMGTNFDHFGKEAHHSYSKHSKIVLANRKLLRETMQKHGFKTIRTEWWHYNYQSEKKYRISDFKWDCD